MRSTRSRPPATCCTSAGSSRRSPVSPGAGSPPSTRRRAPCSWASTRHRAGPCARSRSRRIGRRCTRSAGSRPSEVAPRNGIAELQSSNGMATAFEPTLGGVGIAVALSPDGSRVYFSTEHNRLVSYRPAKSNKPIFKWLLDGDAQAIAASATEIYFGGHFVHMTRGASQRGAPSPRLRCRSRAPSPRGTRAPTGPWECGAPSSARPACRSAATSR